MMLRQMTLGDLETVLDWAAAEGWNPGQGDAAAFRAADPQGFFMAEQDGRLAAAISVVNHDADNAFLGLYICHPDFRGQGIGLALWTHALRHAGKRSVGLDGVPAQQTKYARAGFLFTGSTVRMEGTMHVQTGGQNPSLRLADPGDAGALLALDRAAVGYARSAFLSGWVLQTPGRRTVVADGPAGPIGFATARLCRSGGKIGPVIAPDTATALALIAAAARTLDLNRVALDVPQQNAALVNALREVGFAETFRTARMVRGAPPGQTASLQAVATLELG